MFLRRSRLGLSKARDATIMLAIIAGFVAWMITEFLRAIFG